MTASVLPASATEVLATAEPAAVAETPAPDRVVHPGPESGSAETAPPRADAASADQGAAAETEGGAERAGGGKAEGEGGGDTGGDTGGDGPGPQPIRVLRDAEPLVRLEVTQIEGPQLSDLRAALVARQLISSSDAFVDADQFPVPGDLEAGTPYARVLSPGRTLRLQASGRSRAQRAAAKKDLFADKPLDKDQRAVLPADVKAADAKAGAAAIEQAVAARLQVQHEGLDVFPGTLTAGDGDAVNDPIALDAEGWQKLLERNNLFSGLRLEGDVPAPSPRVAFALRSSLPRFVVHDESSITATVTVSERMHASFSSKIDKVEVEAAYAFVSTKASWSRQQEQATAQATKTMFATGAWNLPRVTLHLPPRDLRAAQGFTRAVQAIVDGPGPSERKFYRLQKLLAEYGQVWATEVTLGGQLSVTSELNVATGRTETQVQSAVQAAVALKFGPASGGAGYGHDSSTRGVVDERSQFEGKAYVATGGDTLKAQEHGKWVGSVGPVLNWRVIRRRGLVPLHRVLDDRLQAQVRDLLEAHDPRYREPVVEAVGDAEPLRWARAERDGFVLFRSAGRQAPAVTMALVQCAGGGPQVVVHTTVSATAPAAGVDLPQCVLVPVRRGADFVLRNVEPYKDAADAAARPGAPTTGRVYALADFDEPAFLAPRSIDTPDDWTAEQDGFLVLATPLGQGPLATDLSVCEGESADDLASVRGMLGVVAGLCVPVRRSLHYAVRGYAATTNSEARSACWFWALNPAVLRFGEPLLDRRQGEWYRADTDGFLLVQLNDSTTGTGVARVETQRPDGVAAETVGASFDNCKPARRGCFGAIILKHHLYRLARHDFQQELLRFYPLVRVAADTAVDTAADTAGA